MENFKIIAFTHKSHELGEIGKLHIEESEICGKLHKLKSAFGLEEIMLLSTCNRVEFFINSTEARNNYELTKCENRSNQFLKKFLQTAYPNLQKDEIEKYISSALIFSGESALRHIFNVASSLDSLVVGEREIISQVRKSYELCRRNNFTGDLLRLVIQKTIECAKQVYTETNIAKNPVSVVSLAYRKLKELHVKLDAKFLIIGAGATNTTMSKYLKKHGFSNFMVFNRTFEKAQKLAGEIGGNAKHLYELSNYKNGFDVIVTCTGSSENIITKEIYSSLVGNDKNRKIVIDLAVPNDFDEEILKSYDVNLIAVNNLQDVAKKNLEEREKELFSCEKIIDENIREFYSEYKERKVEIAMREIPLKVKEIRETAVQEIFAKDIEKLDASSKDTLEKIISYLEKKYISVPMKMAKDILLKERFQYTN